MSLKKNCAWLLSYDTVGRLVRSHYKHGYDSMKEKNIFKFWSSYKADRWHSGFLRAD